MVIVKKYTLVLLISRRHLTPSGMKDSYINYCWYRTYIQTPHAPLKLVGVKPDPSITWEEYARECILSPLRSNLHINDLPYAFQNTLSDPIILPNGTKLNSLLYADDLIILSWSKVRLQNYLKTLHSFSSSLMLDINSKKTKIMIFQKRAKKNST